jgi:hypothetical protein
MLQPEWSCRKKVKHLSQRRLKRAISLAVVAMIHGLVPVWTKLEAKVNRLPLKHHHSLHRHQYRLASRLCRPLTCLYYTVSIPRDAACSHGVYRYGQFDWSALCWTRQGCICLGWQYHMANCVGPWLWEWWFVEGPGRYRGLWITWGQWPCIIDVLKVFVFCIGEFFNLWKQKFELRTLWMTIQWHTVKSTWSDPKMVKFQYLINT